MLWPDMPKTLLLVPLLFGLSPVLYSQDFATWIGLPGAGAWDGQGMQTAWLGDLAGAPDRAPASARS